MFQIGQRVRYNAATRPTYLIGQVGTIVKINPVRVVVDLDTPVGRFHRHIKTPESLLTPHVEVTVEKVQARLDGGRRSRLMDLLR